ncbi:hypothetical protein D9M68_732460 [compost metagenome]
MLDDQNLGFFAKHRNVVLQRHMGKAINRDQRLFAVGEQARCKERERPHVRRRHSRENHYAIHPEELGQRALEPHQWFGGKPSPRHRKMDRANFIHRHLGSSQDLRMVIQVQIAAAGVIDHFLSGSSDFNPALLQNPAGNSHESLLVSTVEMRPADFGHAGGVTSLPWGHLRHAVFGSLFHRSSSC